MSDPEVPQNEQPHDVDDVVGRANEGLDAAAAARENVAGAEAPADAVDSDEAAFAAAEREFPGTFGAPAGGAETDAAADPAAEAAPAAEPAVTVGDQAAAAAQSDALTASPDAGDAPTQQYAPPADDALTVQYAPPSVADAAYGAPAAASAAETQVVPAEPVVTPAPAPQPIFVQAPEPPRELGNRGAIGGIGLLAALSFAILYLGATLGFAALSGTVTTANVGTAALEALQTWSFWVPVVVFYLAFWLLGAFINRARWGKWVIFGLLVAAASYGGHLLGQLFQAPFWRITATQTTDLVNEQMLAPLAIAAFVFARELTIWFGAWAARSGAKKKQLNAEAQAEYERTLEAGPAAAALHGA